MSQKNRKSYCIELDRESSALTIAVMKLAHTRSINIKDFTWKFFDFSNVLTSSVGVAVTSPAVDCTSSLETSSILFYNRHKLVSGFALTVKA